MGLFPEILTAIATATGTGRPSVFPISPYKLVIWVSLGAAEPSSAILLVLAPAISISTGLGSAEPSRVSAAIYTSAWHVSCVYIFF